MEAILILPIIFIFLGGTFIFIGFMLLKSAKKLSNSPYDLVSARISDIIKSKSHSMNSRTTTYYYPVLDFVYNGYSYSKNSNTSISLRPESEPFNLNKFAIGDNVQARIYNQDINTVIIDSSKVLNLRKMVGTIFASMGCFFFLIGLILLFLFINIM